VSSRFLLFALRILPPLALSLLALATVAGGRPGDDVRFSATLTAAQREVAGITVLSADNVAIIDGLVRQDEAASKFKNNRVDHTRFSQRRTDRERDIAGLDRLTPGQITRLDELIGERIAGPPPAPADTVTSASPAVSAADTQRPLDIHGEISFTYGWGKGGSVRGGDVALWYADPERHYTVFFAYSEYRGKGRLPCFYPGFGPGRPDIENLPFAD